MTKILILEDDDFIRQQLAGILQEKGYSVVEAASVGQFNKIYEQEEAAIDVIKQISSITGKNVSKEKEDKIVNTILNDKVPNDLDKMI